MNTNTPNNLPTGEVDNPEVNNTHENQAQQPDNQVAVSEGADRAIKGLAVLGFVALIIFILWVIISLFSFVPSLISQLASLNKATDVDSALIITSAPTSATHGESIFIDWDPVESAESYSISYTCNLDISVEIRLPGGTIEDLPCGTQYTLGQATSAYIFVYAPNTEATTITYSINTELKSGDTVSNSQNLEITNRNALAENVAEEENDTNEELAEDPVTEVETEETPTQVTYREYTYKIPVSDPNGYTDLSLVYKGVGALNSSHDFTPQSKLEVGELGAIRISVKNIGTRTSESWIYTAKLPNGTTYKSPKQTPLKPNEEATITLGFYVPKSKADEQEQFSVSVSTSRDTNRQNQDFSWSVVITE